MSELTLMFFWKPQLGKKTSEIIVLKNITLYYYIIILNELLT